MALREEWSLAPSPLCHRAVWGQPCSPCAHALRSNELNELSPLAVCLQPPHHFLCAFPIHAQTHPRAICVNHCPVAPILPDGHICSPLEARVRGHPRTLCATTCPCTNPGAFCATTRRRARHCGASSVRHACYTSLLAVPARVWAHPQQGSAGATLLAVPASAVRRYRARSLAPCDQRG